MGPAFVWTLVIFVVAFPVMRREDAAYRANATLLMGVLVLLVFAWYGRAALEVTNVERDVVLARPDIDRISQAAMQEIAAIGTGAFEVPATPEWAPYENPESSIALDDKSIPLKSRLAELTRRARKRDVEFARESVQAAADADFEIVVDTMRLADPDERIAARARLNGYREYIESMEPRFAAANERFLAEIASLGLSRGSESTFKAGYEKSMAEGSSVLRSTVQQTLETIDQAEALIQFVDDHARAMRVEGDELRFPDPAAQSEYDELREQLGIAKL
jgi:hypothetical protein